MQEYEEEEDDAIEINRQTEVWRSFDTTMGQLEKQKATSRHEWGERCPERGRDAFKIFILLSRPVPMHSDVM